MRWVVGANETTSGPECNSVSFALADLLLCWLIAAAVGCGCLTLYLPIAPHYDPCCWLFVRKSKEWRMRLPNGAWWCWFSLSLVLAVREGDNLMHRQRNNAVTRVYGSWFAQKIVLFHFIDLRVFKNGGLVFKRRKKSKMLKVFLCFFVTISRIVQFKV